MPTAERVSPAEVQAAMESGEDVLLVCAYDDEAKCRSLGIGGSIPFAELEQRKSSLPRTQRIVFF